MNLPTSPAAGKRLFFLDTQPEFKRQVLEVLHQPLEESLIYI
jgi:predicted ATPase with chaperone activity